MPFSRQIFHFPTVKIQYSQKYRSRSNNKTRLLDSPTINMKQQPNKYRTTAWEFILTPTPSWNNPKGLHRYFLINQIEILRRHVICRKMTSQKYLGTRPKQDGEWTYLRD